MSESTTSTTKKPRWFDTTINLQHLFSAIIGAAIVLVVAWFGLVGRVQALEQKDGEHERRFVRLEGDLKQQRDDTTQQLRDIGGDVKEIRRYLMDNVAGARPDIKRWTR